MGSLLHFSSEVKVYRETVLMSLRGGGEGEPHCAEGEPHRAAAEPHRAAGEPHRAEGEPHRAA